MALARLVLLSLGVIPDQFHSKIVELLDTFLAKAKATGSSSIANAEQQLQCNWLTMVPFVDIFLVPLAGDNQYVSLPSITQTSLSVMMFALMIETSRKSNRELLIRQGLLDFIVSLPWSIPDRLRESSKAVVAVFQKDLHYLPVPRLYSIAAASVRKQGMDISFRDTIFSK